MSIFDSMFDTYTIFNITRHITGGSLNQMQSALNVERLQDNGGRKVTYSTPITLLFSVILLYVVLQ